jgi:hypothetical protein
MRSDVRLQTCQEESAVSFLNLKSQASASDEGHRFVYQCDAVHCRYPNLIGNAIARVQEIALYGYTEEHLTIGEFARFALI